MPQISYMTSTDNVRLGVGLDRRARALDPDELAEILEGALDGGARLIVMCDDVHEDGWAEPIGRLLGKRRDETVLGAFVGGGGRLAPAEECRVLLRRLDVARLDLCLIPARGESPIEERVGELGELVREGLVAGLGLYGDEPEPLARAHAEHALSVAAVDYSLADRRAEARFLPAARELGLPVLACRPLAGGVLAGRKPAADPGIAARLRAAEFIAANEDVGTARLALAWLAARAADLVPVVACSDPIHLEYDLAAMRTRLSSETIAALDAVFPGPRPEGNGG